MRVGRQKLVYGSQRLVSPLEWVNTARVFDGARIAIGAGAGRRLDAFATRLVPVAPRGINDHGPTGSRLFNSQLHGVYYTDGALLPGGAVEGYWLLRREERLDDAVHTIGTRIDARYGPWAFDGELAGQTGSYGGLDHRAAMVHVGGAFTARLPGRPKFGAAFNLGSGDDDPDDGVHRTFDNLYPLNHVYYGTMDLFALQNLRNVEASVDAALPGGASVRVAYQLFALVAPGTDAWYNAAAGIVHAGGHPGVAGRRGQRDRHHRPRPRLARRSRGGVRVLPRRRLSPGAGLQAELGAPFLLADDGRVLAGVNQTAEAQLPSGGAAPRTPGVRLRGPLRPAPLPPRRAARALR